MRTLTEAWAKRTEAEKREWLQAFEPVLFERELTLAERDRVYQAAETAFREQQPPFSWDADGSAPFDSTGRSNGESSCSG